MRVNVYAEEMTDRVEIVRKSTEEGDFTGVRFYLYLPVTTGQSSGRPPQQTAGPFMHSNDDDDSAAVTFWGKTKLRRMLEKALERLDEIEAEKSAPEAA